MLKWELIFKDKVEPQKILNILLKNRNISTKEEKDFLNPKLSDVTIESVGIDKTGLTKAVKRINDAIKNKEQVVVFGDYDVDGICASAIIWESLNRAGAKIMPYIPNRLEEGYGLSVKGIENLLKELKDTKLIITVDNGIVAEKAVDFANSLGIDVIVTDHHVPAKTLPKAHAIVHTTNLCGAGVAYMLSKEFKKKEDYDDHLELAVLATIADLVPLKNANRVIVKYGLLKLRETKRPGLLALFKEAAINQKEIGVYEIGHMIAPRLNAMGRLESAMDSLRLVCTKDKKRAEELSYLLGSTNKERQQVTEETVIHAKSFVKAQKNLGNLLFVSHKSYQQGVIGLVAGRLVEEFYLPSIVIAEGDTYSKASARSIAGFNIIEFIRSASDLLVDAGGHPMAAGFTVETGKIDLLKERLYVEAAKLINEELKNRILKIDCELSLSSIDDKLHKEIKNLEPFGMGNSQPVFVSRKVKVEGLRVVGNGSKHLKLIVSEDGRKIDAIAFGAGEKAEGLKVGDLIDIAYQIDENVWNGNKSIQLKIRDFKIL